MLKVHIAERAEILLECGGRALAGEPAATRAPEVDKSEGRRGERPLRGGRTERSGLHEHVVRVRRELGEARVVQVLVQREALLAADPNEWARA